MMNIFGLSDRENTVPQNAKPTFNAHGTFIKTFIKTCWVMFFDHNGIKL